MIDHLQILRTIDKYDKIGKEGVFELLQKPAEEYGANLDIISAHLITNFISTKGNANEETLKNIIVAWENTVQVNLRVDLMVLLDSVKYTNDLTMWDWFLNLLPNKDETWNNGGRPDNIGWALDDVIEVLKRNINCTKI